MRDLVVLDFPLERTLALGFVDVRVVAFALVFGLERFVAVVRVFLVFAPAFVRLTVPAMGVPFIRFVR